MNKMKLLIGILAFTGLSTLSKATNFQNNSDGVEVIHQKHVSIRPNQKAQIKQVFLQGDLRVKDARKKIEMAKKDLEQRYERQLVSAEVYYHEKKKIQIAERVTTELEERLAPLMTGFKE